MARGGGTRTAARAAKTASTAPHCIHCGGEVQPIAGKVIMAGKVPSYRHVGRVCFKGDPLMDEDVT